MADYFNYAVSISIFIVFLTMVVASGGFGNYVGNQTLNQYNVSKNDLQFNPNISTPSRIELSIKEDIENRQNIIVNNTSNLNNPDFNTTYFIELDNSSNAGYVFYNVASNAEVVDIKSSERSWFQLSEVTLAEYTTSGINDFSNDATDTHSLAGTSDIVFDSSTTYIGFKIDSGSSDKIYDVNYQTDQEDGLIATILAYLQSGAESLSAWTTIITGLPGSLVWLGLAFGIITLLIIIEIITW